MTDETGSADTTAIADSIDVIIAAARVVIHTNGGAKQKARLARLRAEHIAELQQLRAERDDADRRAGAAERDAESLRDDNAKREQWLREAKKSWGVDDRISFDVVWKEALTFRARIAALEAEKADEHADAMKWSGVAGAYTEKSRVLESALEARDKEVADLRLLIAESSACWAHYKANEADARHMDAILARAAAMQRGGK